MTPSESDRYIEQMFVRLYLVHARIHAARSHLADCVGGYRSSTIGAGPSSTRSPVSPDADVPLTVVERAALNPRPDRSRLALQWIDEDLRKASHHLDNLERHVTANWLPGSETAKAADALTRRLDAMWCSNHRQHGIYEPKADDQRLCAWCAATKQAVKLGGTGHLPDAELIDTRHRQGRLTTRDYDQFVQRHRHNASQRQRASRANSKAPA